MKYSWQSMHLTTADLQRKLQGVDMSASDVEIRLHNNQLQSPLPAALFETTTLVLDSNHIADLEELPTDPQPRLLKLAAGWNLLGRVPDQIDVFCNLTVLSLHHNQLTCLPETLGQLTQLRDLNLGYNQLRSLPNLRPLKELVTLTLDNNPLPPQFALAFWLKSETQLIVQTAAAYYGAQRAVLVWLWMDLLPPELNLIIARLIWSGRRGG